MCDQASVERIRQLVMEGELRLAIGQTISLLQGIDSELRNEAIVQSSRLVELERRERRGLSNASEAATNRNPLALAVLTLLDDAGRQLDRGRGPLRELPVTFDIPDEVGLEKILGTNNLKSIAWLSQGIEAAQSVCRVVTPLGVGSGFLIEDGRLLTNEHVIPDNSVAESSHIELGYEESADKTITPGVSYKLISSSLRTSAVLDYSLISVQQQAEQPPIKSWGHLKLSCTAKPRVGDHVVIVQHSQGGPKQIALTAN